LDNIEKAGPRLFSYSSNDRSSITCQKWDLVNWHRMSFMLIAPALCFPEKMHLRYKSKEKRTRVALILTFSLCLKIVCMIIYYNFCIRKYDSTPASIIYMSPLLLFLGVK
jgi:hypothetical protein